MKMISLNMESLNNLFILKGSNLSRNSTIVVIFRDCMSIDVKKIRLWKNLPKNYMILCNTNNYSKFSPPFGLAPYRE